MTALHCDSTLDTGEACAAWDGHPYHGCVLAPGHTGRHTCRCGRTWAGRRAAGRPPVHRGPAVTRREPGQ